MLGSGRSEVLSYGGTVSYHLTKGYHNNIRQALKKKEIDLFGNVQRNSAVRPPGLNGKTVVIHFLIKKTLVTVVTR